MSWPSIALEEIAVIDRDGVQPTEISNGTSFIGLEHIESGGRIVSRQTVAAGELASTKFRFSSDHVLYGKLRPYLAKIALPDFSGVCSTDIIPILPGSNLYRNYLAHYLLQPELIKYAASRSEGANLPRLSPKALANFEIPLPPLAEQKRIAAILDAADALRAKRRESLRLLDALIEKEFETRFGDPIKNSRQLPFGSVGDFVAGFSTGKNLVADDQNEKNGKFKVLKISAVTGLTYKPEMSKSLPPDYIPPDSHIVKPNDLLFSRANTAELVGATAFVFDTPENIALPDKLWRFIWPTKNPPDPFYVWYLFRHPSFRNEIGDRATGTSGSMKNISQGKVLSIRVGIPSIGQQREFGKMVRATSTMRKTQIDSLRKLDSLFASLQQRAFRGEL